MSLPEAYKIIRKNPSYDDLLHFYSSESKRFDSFYDVLTACFEVYEDVGFEIWQVNLMQAKKVFERGPKRTST